MKNLFKDGVPRYVRCYDNGGESIDRFTIVFTRKGAKDGYPYRGYSSSPTHPSGFAQWGEGVDGPIDRPSYSHIGKRVTFESLPAEVRRCALKDYLDMWDQPRLYVDLNWLTKERYRNLAKNNYPHRQDGMWHQGDIVWDATPGHEDMPVGIVLMSEWGMETRLDTNGMVGSEYLRPATMAEIVEHDTLIPRDKIRG